MGRRKRSAMPSCQKHPQPTAVLLKLRRTNAAPKAPKEGILAFFILSQSRRTMDGEEKSEKKGMKSLHLLKISVHLPITTIPKTRKNLALGLRNPSLRGLELAKIRREKIGREHSKITAFTASASLHEKRTMIEYMFNLTVIL